MQTFPDIRTGRNSQYEVIDAGMGAFSVFFNQSPSFLAHQKLLESKYGMSNANTLFGVTQIPSDNQIRNILDGVEPEYLHTVFTDCFRMLYSGGYIQKFRTNIGKRDLLIALDGTWYFSSENIYCTQCSVKEKHGKKLYAHAMINPVIVQPGNKHVLCLPPEFILPQDGDSKQDCEHKAAKRWIRQHKDQYERHHVTILGDDLYCHEPMCRELLSAGYNILLVCKPKSHKTLYGWLTGIMEEKKIRKKIKGIWQTWTYRWAPQVPLRDAEDALLVNWCELTITRESNKKQVYRNAFATNHTVTDATVEEIIRCGRTRWKIENENNNTLKTKGYYLEHNYGHGNMHLASLLAAMNILSLLFHTILDLTDEAYQKLRETIGRRDEFFNHIRILFQYGCFTSWQRLMWFMTEGLKKGHDPDIFLRPI